MLSYTFVWGLASAGIGVIFGLLWLILQDWSMLIGCVMGFAISALMFWLSGILTIW